MQTIALTNILIITAPVFIDGYSQRGAAFNPNDQTGQNVDKAVLTIDLDGGGNAAAGLIDNAPNTTIRGLIFSNFTQDGIRVENPGGGAPAVTNVKITGNFIGTNPTGTAIAANGADGIYVATGATGVTIGGPNFSDRNIISGNTSNGIHIFGPDAGQVTVQNNFIGIDATGLKFLPNGDGILIEASSNNTIGGLIAGETLTNVISGNKNNGVNVTTKLINMIVVDATQNVIDSNWIGTDPRGVQPIANGKDRVLIQDATSNTVLNNVISGNNGNGVELTGAAQGNMIQANDIGTDFAGNLKVPNKGDGISIQATKKNGCSRPSIENYAAKQRVAVRRAS